MATAPSPHRTRAVMPTAVAGAMLADAGEAARAAAPLCCRMEQGAVALTGVHGTEAAPAIAAALLLQADASPAVAMAGLQRSIGRLRLARRLDAITMFKGGGRFRRRQLPVRRPAR